MPPGESIDGLRAILTTLFAFPQNNHYLTALISGLYIAYDIAGAHPIVGRRFPDIDIDSESGSRTLELLHSADPVLLDFSDDDQFLSTATENPGTVRYVSARQHHRSWTLPIIGDIPAPAALLIRPDGYVAWASDGVSGNR